MENCHEFEWRSASVRGTNLAAKNAVSWSLDSHSATLVGNSIYIYGGRQQRKVSGEMHRLRYTDLTWTRILARSTSLPPRRHLHAACLVGSSIYVFGGASRVKVFGDIWKYDLIMREWKKMEWSGQALPSAYGTSAFYVDLRKEILVFGADTSGRVMAFLPELNRMYFPETTGVIPLVGPAHRACASGRFVFVLRTDTTTLSWSLHVLSTGVKQMHWATIAPVGQNPSLRLGCSLSYSFGRLFLFGGKDSERYFDELLVFETSRGGWFKAVDAKSTSTQTNEGKNKASYTITGQPAYCRAHRAIALPDKLLLVGGTSFGSSPVSKVRVIQPVSSRKQKS